MPVDAIEIEILGDGTIKVTTDKISGSNHMAADGLVKFLGELTGGEVTKTKRMGRHEHVHAHEHEHVTTKR